MGTGCFSSRCSSMEPVFYVMAILGCGDLGDQCRPVRSLPVRYASEAACIAATAPALGANTDIDYPTVTAECRRGGRTVLASLR